jgi:hypothetical protein
MPRLHNRPGTDRPEQAQRPDRRAGCGRAALATLEHGDWSISLCPWCLVLAKICLCRGLARCGIPRCRCSRTLWRANLADLDMGNGGKHCHGSGQSRRSVTAAIPSLRPSLLQRPACPSPSRQHPPDCPTLRPRRASRSIQSPGIILDGLTTGPGRAASDSRRTRRDSPARGRARAGRCSGRLSRA